MPIAAVAFNLPEEDYEYRQSMNGLNYRSALDEIRSMIRSHKKHGEDTVIDLNNILNLIQDCIYDCGLDDPR